MRIKPSHGYYDITRFPIGGAFRRAGDAGVEIAEIVRKFKLYHGCDTEGRLSDGTRVAFNSKNIEE